MNKPIVIAIDAMGGDNSPKKIIDGIDLYHQKNKNVYFKLFGDSKIIEQSLKKKNLDKKNYEIVHSENNVKGEDSALAAAKRGKNSSMWKAIESLKEKKADISLSAGNTGALLVMSRLLLKTIDGGESWSKWDPQEARGQGWNLTPSITEVLFISEYDVADVLILGCHKMVDGMYDVPGSSPPTPHSRWNSSI